MLISLSLPPHMLHDIAFSVYLISIRDPIAYDYSRKPSKCTEIFRTFVLYFYDPHDPPFPYARKNSNTRAKYGSITSLGPLPISCLDLARTSVPSRIPAMNTSCSWGRTNASSNA